MCYMKIRLMSIVLIACFFCFCSCFYMDNESEVLSFSDTSFVSDTTNENISESNYDTSEASSDTSKSLLNIDFLNESDSFIWYDTGFVGYSDLNYYKVLTDTYIIAQNEDGVFGTSRIKNGVETAFYPNAYNVYEYGDALYGIVVSEDNERWYCVLNENGSYQKLIECRNVYYFGDKIYYYQLKDGNENSENVLCVYSANIDASSAILVTDSVYDWPTNPKILEYKNHIIYSEFNGGINAVTPEGNVIALVDDVSTIRKIQFADNGYIYYTECVYANKNAFSSPLKATHTLWRVNIDGNVRECLMSVESQSLAFDVAIFKGELLLFTPYGIFAYDNKFSELGFCDYSKFEFGEIAQILVKNDEIVFIGINPDSQSLTIDIYNTLPITAN